MAQGGSRPQAAQSSGWFVGPRDEPDRYELLGEGLTGGEGTTWRARYRGNLNSPIPLAIKLLRPPAGAPGPWPGPADRQRWRDQTALLRHLHLDHLVQLNEIFSGLPPHREGLADGAAPEVAYLEMEWVEGPTLDQLIGGAPATEATLVERLGYLADVAEALDRLHSLTSTGGNPVLFRDVTPANCIVTADRGVVLIDVTTMRLVHDGFDPTGRHTPGYTAPEVLASPHQPRSAAADRFGLGALAAFCITGDHPPPVLHVADLDDLLRRVRGVAWAAKVPDPEAFAAGVGEMLDPDPRLRACGATVWARRLESLAGSRGVGRRADESGVVSRRTAGRWTLLLAVPLVALLAWLAVVLLGRGPASAPGGSRAGGASTPVAASSTGVLGPASTSPETSAPVAATTRPASPSGPGVTVPPSVSSAVSSSSGSPSRTVRGPSGGSPSRTPSTIGTPSRAGTPTTTRPAPSAGPAVGTVTAPSSGDSVHRCEFLLGTATLPPGRTVVLSQVNLTTGDPVTYTEFAYGWQTPPTTPWSWRGAVYFAPHDDSAAGQTFRVDVTAVDLDAAVAAQAAGFDAVNALPAMGQRLASVTVRRVAGPGPADCVGA